MLKFIIKQSRAPRKASFRRAAEAEAIPPVVFRHDERRAGVLGAAGGFQRTHILRKAELSVVDERLAVSLAHIVHRFGDGLEQLFGAVIVVRDDDLGAHGGGQGGELGKILFGADVHERKIRVQVGEAVLLVGRGHTRPNEDAGAVVRRN